MAQDEFTLRKMTDETLRLKVEELLSSLSNIDVDEMTTFELHVLHAFAENPPSKRLGVEWPND